MLVVAEQVRKNGEARLLDYGAAENCLGKLPDRSEMCQCRLSLAIAERVQVLCIKGEANHIWRKLMQRGAGVGQLLEVLAIITLEYLDPEPPAKSDNPDSRDQMPQSGRAEKRELDGLEVSRGWNRE